eukprot:1161157-Pelagomonas_calceolata.AAC.1
MGAPAVPCEPASRHNQLSLCRQPTALRPPLPPPDARAPPEQPPPAGAPHMLPSLLALLLAPPWACMS